MQKIKDRAADNKPPKKPASAYILFQKEVSLSPKTNELFFCRNVLKFWEDPQKLKWQKWSKKLQDVGELSQKNKGFHTKNRLEKVSYTTLISYFKNRQRSLRESNLKIGSILIKSQKAQKVSFCLYDFCKRNATIYSWKTSRSRCSRYHEKSWWDVANPSKYRRRYKIFLIESWQR